MAPHGRIYLKQYNKKRSSASNASTHTSKVAHSPCALVPLSMHGSIILNSRRAIRDNRYHFKKTSGIQVPESRHSIPVHPMLTKFPPIYMFMAQNRNWLVSNGACPKAPETTKKNVWPMLRAQIGQFVVYKNSKTPTNLQQPTSILH